jgi:DnaJ homolog subfamily C member 3
MPPPLLFYGLSVLLTALSVLANANAGSSLYPPGLQPLINRANALLSAGTFHDAAKTYSEAIGT